MDGAFDYLAAAGVGGSCAEASYPYTAVQGSCAAASCTKVAAVKTSDPWGASG